MVDARVGDLDAARILTREECISALQAARIGRVVTTVGADHRPLVRPVSYLYDERTASVIFHSMLGTKLRALLDRRDACFEIDGESDGSLWSVIVRGRIETEDRPDEIARLQGLVLAPALTIPSDGPWVRVRCEVISGRCFVPRADA